ncbi:DeoR/GlpR family DNA-binding transcription regulator [Clostridium botulinum]|uniref:DeoR/GlpR family DNA-binding transcription regulator n=1 Tax=Clostridium botulinum TaxID=1491 RepID=UPI0004D03655|nr:DeoR/GlpR family DNA-binding transcription regulator [Clostridium botulinum]
MKLKPEIRREKILTEIEKNKTVDIMELSEKLQVSEMTIRRDLKRLESSGKLLRTYGGATRISEGECKKVVDDYLSRILKNKDEKAIIGKYAGELVENDDVIMIDASTTALAICKYIRDKKVTVVTNSISVVTALASFDNITVVVACGILRHSSLSLVGSYVEESFKKFNIKKSFISAKALSFEAGLTDINAFEVETKKAAMSVSKEVIVLLDHSKLNNISLLKVCETKEISKIIIDGLKEFTVEEEELLNKFKSNGIEVIIAK